MSPSAHPKWWQLYLAFPILISLFALDGRLRISSRGHEAVQIGIVLLVCGLTSLWIKANGSALSTMDKEYPSTRFRTYRIHSVPLPESKDEKPSTIRIYGVLGTTFEIDYSDTGPFDMDEMPQAMNKEDYIDAECRDVDDGSEELNKE
jgi:hypothetical protein